MNYYINNKDAFKNNKAESFAINLPQEPNGADITKRHQ